MFVKVVTSPDADKLRAAMPSETELSEVTGGLVGQTGLEAHLEDLLRSNIGLLMAASEASGDDGSATESALVVGQQVLDVNGKRCDLVFLTDGGDLAVVELKRDQAAMAHRSEALEFQAVRYAASLATIRTSDDLVTLMFAKYVERPSTRIR